jgi:hypothetical protein
MDAAGTAEEEEWKVHRVLMEKVFTRQAEVCTIAEWAARLR